MNLICFGLSHREAPVEIRERFALGEAAAVEAARRLRATAGAEGEAVAVSTCNRTEFYAVAPAGMGARELCAAHFLDPSLHQAGADHFYHREGRAGVEHLFRVVCGLESMVLGEAEILGQVKRAYQAAAAGGTTARFLNKLFQRAFQVSKLVRSGTAITRGSVSVASVAVDLAAQIFGDLAGRKVMILGAGETGELTARNLLSRGVRSLFVSNRSFDRAAHLAAELGGRAVHFDAWPEEMRDVDIMLSSTAAPHPIVTVEKLKAVMARRSDRPLFVIDLAVPRDVEAACNDLEGVYLYDIDSLQSLAAEALQRRRGEVAACEALIAAHVDEFSAWLAREVPRAEWAEFLRGRREQMLQNCRLPISDCRLAGAEMPDAKPAALDASGAPVWSSGR